MVVVIGAGLDLRRVAHDNQQVSDTGSTWVGRPCRILPGTLWNSHAALDAPVGFVVDGLRPVVRLRGAFQGSLYGSRGVVVAHRGGTGNAPENTLDAIRDAIAHHADAMWLTVQLGKDGVPVLYRPADLSALTDASGPVSARSAAELARVNAGWAFKARDVQGGDDYPYRRRPVGVPTVQIVAANIPDVHIAEVSLQPRHPRLYLFGLARTSQKWPAQHGVAFNIDDMVSSSASSNFRNASGVSRSRQNASIDEIGFKTFREPDCGCACCHRSYREFDGDFRAALRRSSASAVRASRV